MTVLHPQILLSKKKNTDIGAKVNPLHLLTSAPNLTIEKNTDICPKVNPVYLLTSALNLTIQKYKIWCNYRILVGVYTHFQRKEMSSFASLTSTFKNNFFVLPSYQKFRKTTFSSCLEFYQKSTKNKFFTLP